MALKELKQYHFARYDFVNAFRRTLGDAGTDAVEQACLSHVHTENFLLTYHEEEYYVIHRDSGTMINWYKHLGRTNTCSDPSMDLDGLREFLGLLAGELGVKRP